eukprot:scpid83619/ scgid12414/ Protein Tob2; Protein Tob4; Transducer of erbB-2 2
MILEIDVAINFLLSYCYSQLDREKADAFKRDLSNILTKNYTGHWYPTNSQRASAYRALLVSPGVLDPAIVAAAECSQIALGTIRDQLPLWLTIWVDPCEVSYRVGERGEVVSLWQENQQQHLQLRPKEHKSNRKQHKNKVSKSLVRWNNQKPPQQQQQMSSSSPSSSAFSSSSTESSRSPSVTSSASPSPPLRSTSPSTPSPSPAMMHSRSPSPPSSIQYGSRREQQSSTPPPPSYGMPGSWRRFSLLDFKPTADREVEAANATRASVARECADKSALWSTVSLSNSSTWDDSMSFLPSDDSGVGTSPSTSPLMSPDSASPGKPYNCDSFWVKAVSQLDIDASATHSADTYSLRNSMASRRSYFNTSSDSSSS